MKSDKQAMWASFYENEMNSNDALLLYRNTVKADVKSYFERVKI